MAHKSKVALVLLIMVVFGVVVSAWLIIGRGFSAKAEPSAIEAFVARRA